ncbi:peptide ABC transporter substrate-binding protein [Kaistia terrae]|nr:peptide ABC transporter substrate-binding protein [Kaistia terrae]MCX5577997.1 peptide ABC transporter substrate-binding protein [Kaistia terrae]
MMMRFAWIAGVMLAATAVLPASADVIYPRGLVKAPETLDPQKAATFNETPILYDLFEGLVTLDGDGRTVPGAAESWSISPDGLVYTFQLRDGARWSNGAVVKSDDFVASFRRLFAPETGATETGPLLVIRNASAVQQGSAKADTLGVAAPDAKTLEITLDRPVPTFLGRLALPVALPVNVVSIKKLGADFGTTGNIVSNGAYRLAAIDKKDGYILVKNPRFRDAKTLPIDSVVYKPFEDVAGCVDAYRAKAVLSCPDVPAEILPALREEFGSALQLAPYPGTYYFAINTAKPPFDKVEVRRALSLAIDREALARTAWSGAMIPTETLVPPELSGIPAASVAPIETRRAEARTLLEKAGFQEAKLAAPTPEPIQATDDTKTAPAKATDSKPADGSAAASDAAKPDVSKDVTNSITAKSHVAQPGDAQPVAPTPNDAPGKSTPVEPTPADGANKAEGARAADAKAAADAKKPVETGPQPLRLTIRVGTGLGHEETARIIAEQWRTIGVEATIVTEANPAHFARLRDGGDFDIARTGWIADEADPIDLLTVLRSDNVRFNYPRYQNRDYDALLDKAAVDMDVERRKQELGAAAALLAADAPILPVLGYVSLSLVSPSLSGWNANPYNVHPTRFLAVN